MSQENIKVGSRISPLACLQVNEIEDILRTNSIHLGFEHQTFDTSGDKDQQSSLTDDLADDFFTDTIDQALLDGKIDIAIHSAKDLPQHLHDDLAIFALTESVDTTDAFVGKTKFSDLPPGSRIGTSSLIRQESIKSLREDLQSVSIRGNIQQRLEQLDAGEYDGIIVATAALKRLGLDDRIQDIMDWETTPLQGQLAIVGRRDDLKLSNIFSMIDVRKKYGNVLLVGAGPGDPDLITVKGVNALESADCVLYDYLVHKGLLAYATKGEKVYVGKRKGEHSLSQAKLSQLIRNKAMEGQNVVRLKGGDPLIFGRGAEEIDYLRSYHINVEVIPGVSSTTGIPSLLGIPLTARDVSSSVAFLSAHSKDEKTVESTALDIPNVDTLVFLMGLSKLSIIVESLRSANWKATTPILIISRGTRVDEQVVKSTLADVEQCVKDNHVVPPALIIVGNIVNFWNEKNHSKDVILYTGTNPEKYQALGKVVHLPMIGISSAKLGAQDREKLKQSLRHYDIILLTSRFGVKYFFSLLKDQGMDDVDFSDKDFVVIGKDTANELRDHDVQYHLMANIETSQGLFQALQGQYELKDKKILFPRSSLPNPYLKEHLTKSGAQVDELTVYENIKPSKRELPQENITKVIFTSPSTVRNFLQDYGSIPKEWMVISKGPLTSTALKEMGYDSEVLIYG